MSTCFFNSISIGVLNTWISGLCLSLMKHFVRVLILLITSSNFQITRHWIHSQTFFHHFLVWIRRTNRKLLMFGRNFWEKEIFVIIVVLIFTSKSKFRWHSLKIHNWVLSREATWLEKFLIVWFRWILKCFMWMLFWNVLHIWLML